MIRKYAKDGEEKQSTGAWKGGVIGGTVGAGLGALLAHLFIRDPKLKDYLLWGAAVGTVGGVGGAMYTAATKGEQDKENAKNTPESEEELTEQLKKQTDEIAKKEKSRRAELRSAVGTPVGWTTFGIPAAVAGVKAAKWGAAEALRKQKGLRKNTDLRLAAGKRKLEAIVWGLAAGVEGGLQLLNLPSVGGVVNYAGAAFDDKYNTDKEEKKVEEIEKQLKEIDKSKKAAQVNK